MTSLAHRRLPLIILFVLLLVGGSHCTERKEVVPTIRQAHGAFLIRFQGAIEEPPELFTKRPFRLRFRVYDCRKPEAASPPGQASGEETKGTPDQKPAAEQPESDDPLDRPSMAADQLEACEKNYYEITDTYQFGRYYKEIV